MVLFYRFYKQTKLVSPRKNQSECLKLGFLFIYITCQTTPYFWSLVLCKQNLQLDCWQLKKQSNDGHYYALKSIRVLVCHSGLGHSKNISRATFVLSLKWSVTRWEYNYNAQLIPIYPHLVKSKTMSKSI